jgi:hypothetical protein
LEVNNRQVQEQPEVMIFTWTKADATNATSEKSVQLAAGSWQSRKYGV